jgi:hypothetical protein
VIDHAGKDIPEKWDLFITLEGVDWKNLVAWCRKAWEDTLSAMNIQEDGTSDWALIGAATRIADEAHENPPWEAVERQLNALRVVARNIDKKWWE